MLVVNAVEAVFPHHPTQQKMASCFYLVQPCSSEGCQDTERPERPAEHMELLGGEVVKPLLGMAPVIPDRQAVCALLTALDGRGEKESG